MKKAKKAKKAEKEKEKVPTIREVYDKAFLELITEYESKISSLRATLATKTRTIADYDTVWNALPSYLTIAVADALVLAHNDCDNEEIVDMVSEKGQERVRDRLSNAPTRSSVQS